MQAEPCPRSSVNTNGHFGTLTAKERAHVMFFIYIPDHVCSSNVKDTFSKTSKTRVTEEQSNENTNKNKTVVL